MKKLLISFLLAVGLLAISNSAKAEDYDIFGDGVSVATLTAGTVLGFIPGPALVTGVHFSSNPAGQTVPAFLELLGVLYSPSTASMSPTVYTSTYPTSQTYRIYVDSAAETDGARTIGTIKEFRYPKFFPRGVTLRASVSTYNLIGVDYLRSRAAGQSYP